MTQERTFARPVPRAALAPDVPGLRLQEKQDAWPLHQLYLRSTPQGERIAEGRTARDWQVPGKFATAFVPGYPLGSRG